MADELSRRDFVSTTSKLAFGGMIVPRHVIGGPGFRAPSDTLNVAIIGAGGMGASNAQKLGSENIVAVCDLDHRLVENKVREEMTDGDGNPREEGHRWARAIRTSREIHPVGRAARTTGAISTLS